jgi:hypothetical protein
LVLIEYQPANVLVATTNKKANIIMPVTDSIPRKPGNIAQTVARKNIKPLIIPDSGPPI